MEVPLPAALVSVLAVAASLALGVSRASARRRRHYTRMRIEPYRADHAHGEALRRMLESLHLGLLRPWWARLVTGQPSVSLEVHHGDRGSAAGGWFAVSFPSGSEDSVEAVLRTAYPNCRLRRLDGRFDPPPVLVRLRKRHMFIRRANVLERFEQLRELPVDRLLTVMGSFQGPSLVQLALTPAPDLYRSLAKQLHLLRQDRARAREHGGGGRPRDGG